MAGTGILDSTYREILCEECVCGGVVVGLTANNFLFFNRL